MALRYIFRIDEPKEKKTLKMNCRPIKLPDRSLKTLINDMFDTMYAFGGVGLAAPQVGIPIRLIVIGIPDIYEKHKDGTESLVSPAEEHILINPRIIKLSNEEVIRDEGCLSLPNWMGHVPRVTWTTIEYLEFNGKQRRLRKADGLLGWTIQHEIDHINGVLFTERIRDWSTFRDVSKEEEKEDQTYVLRHKKAAA